MPLLKIKNQIYMYLYFSGLSKLNTCLLTVFNNFTTEIELFINFNPYTNRNTVS